MNKINELKQKFTEKPFALSPTKRLRKPFKVNIDSLRFSELNNSIYCDSGLLYDDETGEDALAFFTAEEALDYFDNNLKK